MWFKQVQLFQLANSLSYSSEELTNKLATFAFKPCLPSFASSIGWVAPLDEEDAPLLRLLNGYIMLCLQIEEKILPAAVIRQELDNKIKQIEASENRKLRQKEKLSLKDDLITTLLPRAFSKYTRLYAYIDIKNHWLILGTANEKKTEQFLSSFKKTISEKIHSLELKKLAPVITQWLKDQHYPTSFAIEKACLLQDPNQQTRVIRCQHQDLFAPGIQALIKEGCEVKQLALSWQDRVNFVLIDTFVLRGLKFQEEILAQVKEMEAETKQQQFDADFFIMSEIITALLKDLLGLFLEPSKVNIEKTVATEPA